MIRRNVELEAHFVDDLLDVTRIVRQKVRLKREPVDLHEVLRRAVEIVRGDVETVRAHVADLVANAPHTLPSYLAMARATLDRAVTDGRLLPIRASKMLRVLDAAEVGTPMERHL